MSSLTSKEVKLAVREWLHMREPDLYRDGIYRLVLGKERDKCAWGLR